MFLSEVVRGEKDLAVAAGGGFWLWRENLLISTSYATFRVVYHDGKVGCSTVEHTMAFLYSDWLYFLWRGKNISFLQTFNMVK